MKRQINDDIASELDFVLKDLINFSDITLETKKQLLCLYGGLVITMFGTNCESAARFLINYTLNISNFAPDLLPVLLPSAVDPLIAYGLSNSESVMDWIQADLVRSERYSDTTRIFFNENMQTIKDAIGLVAF